MHAEKCPVCDGSGKYCIKNEMQHINDKIGFKRHEETCHGCGGKGWVEVGDGPYYTLQPNPYAPSIQPPEPNDIPPYSVGDFPGWEPRYITGGVS